MNNNYEISYNIENSNNSEGEKYILNDFYNILNSVDYNYREESKSLGNEFFVQ